MAAKKKDEQGADFTHVPMFNKWDMGEIEIVDLGLARYINLDPINIPHISARYANRPFHKQKVNIVERLITNMMRSEKYTGKKSKSYAVVEKSFDIINRKTKKNPIQVFVDALQNAAPREEVTRLRYGGISVPKAVDCGPCRRLDFALRYICQAANHASFKNRKSIEECLANEIILAANGDINSFAISKKEEIERVAQSAR